MLISVIGHSKDATLITKQIKEQQAEQIEESLKRAFPEESQRVDLVLLASYLAMSQLNLMTWWLENRTPHSPEEIASLCHRFQRAAICEAFHLPLDILP
ncbi:MAG: TetR-like C-terminal domain-containing protein [Anaerolineae bacterium]